MNKNILSVHWQTAIMTWFSLRLDVLTVTFMGLACFLGISMRHKADPIFISMMLSYVLLLQKQLLISIRIMGWIEGKMVNFDRCLKLLEIAQEDMGGNNELAANGWP